MQNKEGKRIVSCPFATNGIGNCVTCMWFRNWVNTRSLHEGEPDYCSCPDAKVESAQDE